MADLLGKVLEAHGGLERWQTFSRVRVRIVSGGQLWAIKGQPQDPAPRTMTVALRQQWASVQPFGRPDQRTDFTPGRIAIEQLDGRVVAERLNPRDSFAGHGLDTQWDPLQRAYFNGYALWTYLTTPFLLAMPGFSVHEIESVKENGETWYGLQARFPDSVASHSPLQEFYFGEDNVLRRHDYRVDVAGGFHATQYVYDIVEADGFRIPSRRRAYRNDANGHPILEQPMVSIDIDQVRFE